MSTLGKRTLNDYVTVIDGVSGNTIVKSIGLQGCGLSGAEILKTFYGKEVVTEQGKITYKCNLCPSNVAQDLKNGYTNLYNHARSH